jgi:hypothetical protein
MRLREMKKGEREKTCRPFSFFFNFERIERRCRDHAGAWPEFSSPTVDSVLFYQPDPVASDKADQPKRWTGRLLLLSEFPPAGAV